MNIALPSLQPNSVPPVESCKTAVFKIADHWLALPATTILKVIPSSALENDDRKLLVWDNQPVVRLDLHQLLTRRSLSGSANLNPPAFNLRQYTMIVWSQMGERCSIRVDELPVLHELSLSKAQVLPSHYRQSIHNIAKYLIMQPYQGDVLNILLLDLQQALNRTVK